MKAISILSILILIFSVTTLASEQATQNTLKSLNKMNKLSKSSKVALGGNHGGGGEPSATEFIEGLEYVCQWMQYEPFFRDYAQRCIQEKNDLEKSLNDQNRRPRVLSWSDDEIPDNKLAYTNLDARVVLLAEKRWPNSSVEYKLLAEAMEMALLLGIPDRYNISVMFKNSSVFRIALERLSRPSVSSNTIGRGVQYNKQCQLDLSQTLNSSLTFRYTPEQGRQSNLVEVWDGAELIFLGTFETQVIKFRKDPPQTVRGYKFQIVSNNEPWHSAISSTYKSALPGDVLWQTSSLEFLCR